MDRGNGQSLGFIAAKGSALVDCEGKELLLRGVGFGGWLVPEGYMLGLPSPLDRPRRIEAAVAELAGADYAEAFWKAYRERYVAEADIAAIAAEGLNSVRIPMSARLMTDASGRLDPKSPGMAAIDRILASCARHGVYAILDLHAAKGGQTGANIDDSERDLPELFTDQANQESTIALWRDLAERYANDPVVAGYDLLNEPLLDTFKEYYTRLTPLYDRIIGAIREVDTKHLIILEGLHWATDWSVFGHRFDENALYQFHKYRNAPDAASIRPYLETRERLGAPIFMGEGGENNRAWYSGAFSLFEEYGLSWNFWTWKKMGADNSPCCVVAPRGWERIVDWARGGPKPGREEARTILDDYLEAIAFERCAYRGDVLDAILRRPGASIPAIFFDRRAGYGRDGAAGFREGEGFDIRPLEEGGAASFSHPGGESWKDDERLILRAHPGESYSYRFSIPNGPAHAGYRIELRCRATEGEAELRASVDGGQAQASSIPPGDWRDSDIWKGQLCSGPHSVAIEARQACADALQLRPRRKK
jgi:Endoglucanase